MANNKACIQLLSIILLSGFLYLETVRLSSCQGDPNLGCRQIEKEALIEFKKSLTDPSDRLSSWVIGGDCCNWSGVVCNNRTGHVVKLKLRNLIPDSFDADGTTHRLGGKINSSLLDLKYLNYLDLSSNNFGGSEIPKFFGSLEKLRYLNLSGASFGGTIPPLIGNLSNLRYLDLNTYSDKSPENDLQWLSGLSSLKHLNLRRVDLSKAADHWLQAVNMLPSLLELHLPICALSKLPLSLPFVNFSSLLVLDLSNNGFDSSIPPWLFNLHKLQHLDLNSNNLRGTIPDAFANLTSLEKLDLSQNYNIGGRLSGNLGNLCNLRILSLSQNNISGEITELIDGLSSCNDSRLESMDLGYNKLGGFLPDSLGHLKSLKYLQLWENSFVGSIPNSIGNLSSLTEFYLSNNKFNGTIPESLGQLSTLAALAFSGNSWTGVITEAHFSNLISLTDPVNC
ncbi:hypothetical protein L1049_014729 [Liquidambar formosana]|uniref:Leucine-rich repeat-containing N-terminal plant-type domain-containing protein n=1 Tax=Liquidambar formosana TaxID=63359 RepID=A0AAP0S2J1_LIQFO